MGGEFTVPASYPTVKLTLQYFLVFHVTSFLLPLSQERSKLSSIYSDGQTVCESILFYQFWLPCLF